MSSSDNGDNTGSGSSITWSSAGSQRSVPLTGSSPQTCSEQFTGFLCRFFTAEMSLQRPRQKDVVCQGTKPAVYVATLLVLAGALTASFVVPDVLLSNRSDETSLEQNDILDMTEVPGFLVSAFLGPLTFRFFRGAQAAAESTKNCAQFALRVLLALVRSVFHELPSLLIFAYVAIIADPFLLNLITLFEQTVAFGSAIALTIVLKLYTTITGLSYSPFSVAQERSALAALPAGNTDSIEPYQPQAQNLLEEVESKAVHALNIYGYALPWPVLAPLIWYIGKLQIEADSDMGTYLCLLKCALIGTGLTFASQFSFLVSYLHNRRKGLPSLPTSKGSGVSFSGQILDRLASGVLAPIALCALLKAIVPLESWPVTMDWIDNPKTYGTFCHLITILLSMSPSATYRTDTGWRYDTSRTRTRTYALSSTSYGSSAGARHRHSVLMNTDTDTATNSLVAGVVRGGVAGSRISAITDGEEIDLTDTPVQVQDPRLKRSRNSSTGSSQTLSLLKGPRAATSTEQSSTQHGVV